MAYAVVGLSGIAGQSGGVRLLREQLIRMELPPAITLQHVDMMRNDLAEIQRLATQYPEKIATLQNAFLANDLPEANRLANEIGLTEERLGAAGGGQLGEAALLVLVIILVATSNGTKEPVAQTPEPDDTAGAPNAGAPGGTP